MSTTITDKKDKKRIEIGKVIHRCNALCDEVNMIFFLPNERYASPYRYTASNPSTFLEFLVVTWNEKSANRLQLAWIIESAKQGERTAYSNNLLIMAEKEFLDEYEKSDQFKELLDTAVVVYDADAEFVLKLGGL